MNAARHGRRAGKALIGRRNLVGLAGGLVAALLPRFARAQRDVAPASSLAKQDARREAGWLGQSADNLLRLTVADGPAHSAHAVVQFRQQQGRLARDLCSLLNTRLSEDDWLPLVPARELDLALAMQPLFIRLVPSLDEVEAAIKAPLPVVEPLAGDDGSDVLQTIVLNSLGLERRGALFEQLRNNVMLELVLKDAATAVKEQRYGLAALELERIMRIMVLPETVAAVTEYLGTGARYRLYKSLVVHFVPFVGWSYFVSYLLATIYLNRDTTAAVLR